MTANAVVEGALAFIGAVAFSVALSIAFYAFVLRPLTRHLDRSELRPEVSRRRGVARVSAGLARLACRLCGTPRQS